MTDRDVPVWVYLAATSTFVVFFGLAMAAWTVLADPVVSLLFTIMLYVGGHEFWAWWDLRGSLERLED